MVSRFKLVFKPNFYVNINDFKQYDDNVIYTNINLLESKLENIDQYILYENDVSLSRYFRLKDNNIYIVSTIDSQQTGSNMIQNWIEYNIISSSESSKTHDNGFNYIENNKVYLYVQSI